MVKLEDRLGWICFHFRGTRDEAERKRLAQDYAATVFELIESNLWSEFPGPEDMLPDAWMPDAFFEYWKIMSSRPPGGYTVG